MLKMLSGCVSAVAGMFGRKADWAGADTDEINKAMQTLLERRYGWHTKCGGGSGVLYYRRDGDLAGAQPDSFYPASSWRDAMKAAKECVEGGMRVNVPLRKGRCGPRHLCVRLLTACGAERPVPEIACGACGETARRFVGDAKAEGWSALYCCRPWQAQSLYTDRLSTMFPENGWGYVGRCPSCVPRERRS